MVAEQKDCALDLSGHPAPRQMELVLEELYPTLFHHLNLARHHLEEHLQEDTVLSANGLVEEAFTELDAMLRQEKYLLFPFLQKLYNEGKKSENCAAFKLVKAYYTASLRLCATIQSVQTSDAEISIGASVALINAKAAITQYMKLLISCQEAKEVFLYKPFKSCSGCSTISVTTKEKEAH